MNYLCDCYPNPFILKVQVLGSYNIFNPSFEAGQENTHQSDRHFDEH